MLSVVVGFLLGALAVVAAEALALLALLGRVRRKKGAESSGSPPPVVERDLDGEQSLAFAYNKKGVVWVLEPDKVPKGSSNESRTKVPKEQKSKKEIVEVFPVKKYAKIKDHYLILTDLDGSQSQAKATIQLTECSIMAVSGSDLSSRKWAKRYPIIVESKKSVVYNGSKTCYLFLETSWEKESWCKALRLASCSDMNKIQWYAQLSEDFPRYLASLNAEYPSFLKPSAMFGEAIDKTVRIDGSTSKVRHFLKKIAKKASKASAEYKGITISSSSRGERKISEKSHASQDALSASSLANSSSAEKSSSSSSQDLLQPTSPTSFHLGNQNQVPVFSDIVCDEKFGLDEGTLCLNLLLSRLFFDARRSKEMCSFIKARIQRSLLNMRTPSYIGGVTCTGLDLGNFSPFIHHIRLLPVDLNEVWAVEVDIEYAGGVLLDIVTRLEVREPDFQKGFEDTTLEPSTAGEVTSDLLEGIESYGNHLKFSSSSTDGMENRVEEGGLKQSKSTSWTSTYVSRWKSIVKSIAVQVSQVPLSLAIRVASLRGTLRIHIKPPPSDQLWFGFTSMPEIDWNLDSHVGEHKITSGQIALLIGNRFKTAISETMVLPNCESICIPWMLAEKDDWAPRSVAPFIWARQEVGDVPVGDESSTSQPRASETKQHSVKESKASSGNILENDHEKINSVVYAQPSNKEPVLESSTSQNNLPTSVSRDVSEDLRAPLLRNDENQGSCSQRRVEFSEDSSSGEMVTAGQQTVLPSEEDSKPKRIGRKARMMDLGKKVGEKLEEKRRHIEEKGRHIVEKMRENARPENARP